jgi:hypothetical protein
MMVVMVTLMMIMMMMVRVCDEDHSRVRKKKAVGEGWETPD